MINVTKAELLSMICQTLSKDDSNQSLQRVRTRADEFFAKAFVLPNRVQGDRMLLSGYTVLLDRDVEFRKFLSPGELLNTEMLMSKSAIELYFIQLGMELGWAEERAIHNSHYIAHLLDPISRSDASVLF